MKYPSVTQILKPWRDFSGISDEVLQAAADRGIALHEAYAAYAQDLWVPWLPEVAQGYFKSFQSWFDLMVVETVAVEVELICKEFGYIGHADWIGRLQGDERLTLIDWKHPVLESKTWCLQISAYAHQARKEHHIERIAVVQPRKSGRRAKFTEYSGTLARDFAVFLSCLNAHKFFYGGK